MKGPFKALSSTQSFSPTDIKYSVYWNNISFPSVMKKASVSLLLALPCTEEHLSLLHLPSTLAT